MTGRRSPILCGQSSWTLRQSHRALEAFNAQHRRNTRRPVAEARMGLVEPNRPAILAQGQGRGNGAPCVDRATLSAEVAYISCASGSGRLWAHVPLSCSESRIYERDQPELV